MIYTLDASLEKCPLPLVKLRVILKKMQTNDVCVLHISDKGSKKDIPKLLTTQGYMFSLCEKGKILELTINGK